MKDTVREQLISAGYDVDGALARFVNNEILYMTFLKKFPSDEHYGVIKPKLVAKEYDEAYKAAHAIKGVAGNLGLTPVFETVNELLQLIKKKDEVSDFDNQVMLLFEKFEEAYGKSVEIIGSIE